MPKRSLLVALTEGRCPRCRQGKMFQYTSVAPNKFSQVNTHCHHCGLKFEVEPGFWFGAMYVSYALTTGLLLVITFLLYHLADDPSLTVYGIVIAVSVLALVPFTFRLSRILYLHAFGGVPYNPSLAEAPSKDVKPIK